MVRKVKNKEIIILPSTVDGYLSGIETFIEHFDSVEELNSKSMFLETKSKINYTKSRIIGFFNGYDDIARQRDIYNMNKKVLKDLFNELQILGHNLQLMYIRTFKDNIEII